MPSWWCRPCSIFYLALSSLSSFLCCVSFLLSSNKYNHPSRTTTLRSSSYAIYPTPSWHLRTLTFCSWTWNNGLAPSGASTFYFPYQGRRPLLRCLEGKADVPILVRPARNGLSKAFSLLRPPSTTTARISVFLEVFGFSFWTGPISILLY